MWTCHVMDSHGASIASGTPLESFRRQGSSNNLYKQDLPLPGAATAHMLQGIGGRPWTFYSRHTVCNVFLCSKTESFCHFA